MISLPALFQIMITCASFIAVCWAFFNWKRRRIRYFFCMATMMFINCAGYLITLLTPTLEGALIGTRISFFGAPYIGIFCILFCREYVEHSAKSWVGPVLAIFPMICTALVLSYPHNHLLYKDIQPVITSQAFYLDLKGGILYYPYFFYSLALITYGTVYLMIHLKQLETWHIRNTILFSAWFACIAISVVLRMFRLTPGYFNLMPALETLYLLLIILHIRHFRWQEWHSEGRELAVENLKDAFILIDENKRFLDANEAAFQYFPELRAFRIGMPLSKLGSVADQLFNPEEQSLSLQLEENRYFRISRSFFSHAETRKTIGHAVMLYDDTMREHLIMQLNEARNNAEQATQAKSLFLARTSHEIRTPMNAILGMAELILRQDLPPDVYEDVLEIRQAGYILLSIINDILDFSKIESGKMEIASVEYHFTSIINDVISIIRTRLVEKHVRFITNIDSHLPNALIGDEARLRQILLNLLSNAVKYTEQGSITLTVSAEDSGNVDSGSVIFRFEVADTGSGIKASDLPLLFTDFSRFDSQSNIEGTGLGLVIARQLARLMGGDIIVKSEYGKGSVFTVILPQKIADPAPFAAVMEPAAKTVLLFERRSVYADSIAYSLDSLDVPYELVTSWDEFIIALERKGRNGYSFVFVPSIFLEQVQKIFYEDAGTPAAYVLPKTGANTIIVNLADTRLGQPQRNVHTLYMPAYVLPIANILNGDESPNHNATVGRNTPYNVRFIAPDAHVLAVDDVTTNLKVLRGLTAPYKMQIDCCTNGNEALKLVQEKVYDLVFLDHMMPGMDGIETLKAIRALGTDYYQNLPIVALTANAMQGMREQYLGYGFQDYLIKPIEIARLDAVLAHWLPYEKRIKGKESYQMVGNTDENSWLEKLQTIEGLDIQDALSHVGSLENYVEVLKQFHTEMKVYIKSIQTAFDEMNWKDYTLRLHAVKGAFGTIGMKSISEWARELEMAAKKRDVVICQEQTESFCGAIAAFEERLDDILPDQQETRSQDDAPPVDAAFVKEKLEALYLACYNFKSDDAEAIINTLNQVSFQEQWYGSLATIRTLVGSYEYGAAEKAIQALLTELREA